MNCTADLDGSLIAPTIDKTLSSQERLAAVKSVLEDMGQQCTATIFDAKEHYKVLCRCCGIAPRTRCADPKVACWLLDPSSNDKNLHCLVTNYCPLETGLLQGQPFCLHVTVHREIAQCFTGSFKHAVSGK